MLAGKKISTDFVSFCLRFDFDVGRESFVLHICIAAEGFEDMSQVQRSRSLTL